MPVPFCTVNGWVFVLQWQHWIAGTKSPLSTEPKIFTIWFLEKVCRVFSWETSESLEEVVRLKRSKRNNEGFDSMNVTIGDEELVKQ